MSRMKILLLGKNGQVGWELQRSLAPLGEVVALDFDSPGPLTADFSKPESLAATVRAVAPDVIVNAAARDVIEVPTRRRYRSLHGRGMTSAATAAHDRRANRSDEDRAVKEGLRTDRLVGLSLAHGFPSASSRWSDDMHPRNRRGDLC